MTFELTVTLQIHADTLGAAVTEIEARIRSGSGALTPSLSAMTGKLLTETKGKDRP